MMSDPSQAHRPFGQDIPLTMTTFERGAEEGIGGEVRTSNGRSGYDKGGWAGGTRSTGSGQSAVPASNEQCAATGDW